MFKCSTVQNLKCRWKSAFDSKRFTKRFTMCFTFVLHALSLVKVLQAPSKTRPRQQMTWGTPASMKAPYRQNVTACYSMLQLKCGSTLCFIFVSFGFIWSHQSHPSHAQTMKLVLQHLQNRSKSERRHSKGISGLRRLRVFSSSSSHTAVCWFEVTLVPTMVFVETVPFFIT